MVGGRSREKGAETGVQTPKDGTEAQGKRGRNRQTSNWEMKGEIVLGTERGDGVVKTEASGRDRRGDRLC